jgi:RNA polymerase sigma-70 factor (ECF subfamily)
MEPSQLSTPGVRYAGEEESALLAALRAGSADAFEALVRANGGRMLAVTRRFLRNDEDARDAVQDAFLSAFKGLATFDGRAALSTWLHRIAVRAALQKLRTQQRRPERAIEDFLPRFLPDGHQADPAVPWQEAVDAVLQRQELCGTVRACIDRLPEDYRIVLLLRDIEELDTEETAQLLGMNASAVKTRLHRARQALRVLLDPHFRGGAL